MNRLSRYLSLVLAAVALTAAVPALAEDPAPGASTANNPASAKMQLGRITVTGSAVPRTSVETPAPVSVITAKQIEASGLTTISDVLRSVTADNSGTIPLGFTLGFAAGSTGLALRGLTVNSTLILIDGHRTAAYALADDGERSFTDLNTIPLNAVDHIEILRDGASAIYGADAIAGVVNIILVKNYQESQVKADVGTSQHGGGSTTQFSFLSGTGDIAQDKYNAWINFEYEKDNPIHNRDRGFPYNTADTSSLGGLDLNAGNPGLFFGSGYGAVAPSDAAGNTSGPYQPLRACNPADSKQVSVAGTGTFCEQNFVSLNDEVSPEEDRYGLQGRMTAAINPAATVNLTASFYQTRTVSTANPSQIQVSSPNNTDAIVLPPTLLNGKLNPNDPFAASGKFAAINYAFGDIPGGFTDVNHNLRLVAEVNGDLGPDWSYDGALTINHTWLNVNNRGFIDFHQLQQDIATGDYSFVNPASNSQAVRDALSPTIAKTSTTDMDVFDFTANRSLMDLSGGPLGLALGGQWRYEAQDDPDLNPNQQFQGLGVAHTIGSRTVSAGYVELDAPVLESLELDFAGREDHYSDFGSAFSPKFGVKWTPLSGLGFRGTYSKGFRAPSFAENGSSAAEGFITYTLPAAYIAAHGNDAYVQPYSLGLLTSANPNIQPERARNYTLGMIFQPLDSLNGTVDYYNIIKTGVIAQSSPFDVLNAYFAGQPLPPGSTLSQDVPDPAHPSSLPRPTLVAAPYVNENELKTSGVDLDLVFRHGFGTAQWTSELQFTRILSFEETLSAGGPLVNYVGTQGPYILSSGAGTPRDRVSWANGVDVGPASITATINYVSGMFMSVPDVTGPNTGNLCFSTATPTGANLPADCRVSSFTSVDLTGEYNFTDKVAGTMAILNVFDRKAPFDPIDYAGVNYNPTYHSAGIIGRFFTIGLKAKF